jgi:hypothetical protein
VQVGAGGQRDGRLAVAVGALQVGAGRRQFERQARG